MAKFLFTILRWNDLGLPRRRASGKVIIEKFLETDIWLKRDGNSQVAREHYSVAVPVARERPQSRGQNRPGHQEVTGAIHQ